MEMICNLPRVFICLVIRSRGVIHFSPDISNGTDICRPRSLESAVNLPLLHSQHHHYHLLNFSVSGTELCALQA